MNAVVGPEETVIPVETAAVSPARAFVAKTGFVAAMESLRTLNEEMKLEHPGMDVLLGVIENSEIAHRRFIRLCNGTWFNSTVQVESAYEAYNRFGTAGFYKIAAAACLVTGIGELPGRSKIWPHLEAVARTAENVALELAPDLADEAFCAGVLHDAMVPAMSKESPDYIYFIECAIETDPVVAGMERDSYQFDHAEAAAALAQELGFSGAVVEAVRVHHHESISAIEDPKQKRLVSLLMIAERICSIRRVKADDIFNNPPEQALLNEISAALEAPVAKIIRTAAENLKKLRLLDVE